MGNIVCKVSEQMERTGIGCVAQGRHLQRNYVV